MCETHRHLGGSGAAVMERPRVRPVKPVDNRGAAGTDQLAALEPPKHIEGPVAKEVEALRRGTPVLPSPSRPARAPQAKPPERPAVKPPVIGQPREPAKLGPGRASQAPKPVPPQAKTPPSQRLTTEAAQPVKPGVLRDSSGRVLQVRTDEETLRSVTARLTWACNEQRRYDPRPGGLPLRARLNWEAGKLRELHKILFGHEPDAAEMNESNRYRTAQNVRKGIEILFQSLGRSVPKLPKFLG